MTSPVLFRCVAGPDSGKRLALNDGYVRVGRAAECNVLSDDPDVADRHVVLTRDGQRVTVEAVAGAAIYVDGQLVRTATLAIGQQVRVGRSLWEVAIVDAAHVPQTGIFGKVRAQVAAVAGVDKLQGWSAGEMFSDVFKRRTDEEQEEYFNVGTRTTTPPLGAIEAGGWPKPWAFVRFLILSSAVFALFAWAWNRFSNPYLIPGLILVGSFAIPCSILVFFFEMNVPRNVSLYQILKLLLLGGIVSLCVSLLFFEWTSLDNWLGAMSAGIVEESGKALTLLLVVRKRRYPWTLNGMLFGATVGTGFAVFETSGYALTSGLNSGMASLFQTIYERGALSVLGGHALWTALVGGALWRVRGQREFKWDMLREPAFLRVFALCVALHMLWNSPLDPPLELKFIAIGFITWIAVLSYIQFGLAEIRQAQRAGGDTEAIVIPIESRAG
jgi:RsiW-degrading membrane proteinase PrsW (M82 family)